MPLQWLSSHHLVSEEGGNDGSLYSVPWTRAAIVTAAHARRQSFRRRLTTEALSWETDVARATAFLSLSCLLPD